jgi:hypothetical protein
MPIKLDAALRAKVVKRLLVAQAHKAEQLYFEGFWSTVATSAIPDIYVDALLSEAERLQDGGSPEGPLLVVAAKFEQRGWPEGAQLRAAVEAVAQSPAAPNPFTQTRVGWRRTLLLDHESFRLHLEEACTGNRRGVWLPAPLGPASSACAELVTAVGDSLSTRVATTEWQPGSGLTLQQMVEDLLLYLEATSQSSTAQDNAIPDTTSIAHVNGLAQKLVRAARNTPSDVILVFQNFRVNESPAECIRLIEELIRLVCGGTFARRLRVVLLGCELNAALLPRTPHDAFNESQLRQEAQNQLITSGLSPQDANDLLSDFWVPPLDLDVVHQRVAELLESI